MIRPTKFMHPDTCVLRCAGVMLEALVESKRGRVSIPDLEVLLVKNLGEVARQNLIYSLGFLFLLSLVRYDGFRDEVVLQSR